MSETTRKVGSAIFWSVSAKGGRFVLGLVTSVLVVRGLGEHDYGVLSLIRASLSVTIVLGSVGIGQSLLKFLPTLRVAGDRAQARLLVRHVMLIQAIAWGVLAAVAYVLTPWFESLFGIEGIGFILSVAVVLSVFDLFFQKLAHVLNACYDTKLLSAAQIISHVVFTLLILIVMSRGYGVLGVIIAGAAGQALACFMIIPKVFRVLAGRGTSDGTGGIGGRRLLRFSVPFAAIGILNMIVWRQSEVFFLAHFRTPEETGYFDLAYRIPQMMLEFVPGTIWPIIMAGFSEVYAKNPAHIGDVIRKYYKMLFLFSTPICFFGITFGGRIITMAFGEAMAPASVPTQVFFGIFTVSFFATPLSMSLYVMEKTHINLLIYLLLAVINVGLDILLIPRFGIVGAIIPVGLVILIQPFIYRFVLGRLVSGVRIPFGFIARCFAASSLVLLTLPLVRLVDGLPGLLTAVVTGAVLVVLGFKYMKVIGQEERALLSSVPLPISDRLIKFVSS